MLGGQRIADGARPSGGWWTRRRRRTRGRARDYAFSLDGGPPRPDPRSAFAARRRPRPVPGRRPRRVRLARQRLARAAAGRVGPLRVPRRHVLGRGHLRRRDRAPGPPRRPRRRRHRADAGGRVPRATGAGATTASTCSPRTTPTAARTASSGSSTPATPAGSAWSWTSSTTTSARPGTTCRSSARTSRARHQTNWGDAVNFDGPGSDEVRRFVIDNALMWLRDYHCDGLRLDAVHAIVDDSATHILRGSSPPRSTRWPRTLRRPLFLIAESDRNDPRLVRGRDAGGYGLDAAWADEWHHALHAVLTGERDGYYEDFGPLPLLAKALRQAWVYDGIYSPHRQRVHGRPPAGLAGDQFVVCTQNHDQVGNRAAGERTRRADQRRPAAGGRRPAADLAVRADAVPGRGVGREHAVPVLHRPRRSRARAGPSARAGARSSPRSAGIPTTCPIRRTPATFERSRLDWAEAGQEPPRRPAGLVPRADRAAPAAPGADRSPPRPGRDRVRSAAGWLVVRRGPVAVASNLGSSAWTFPAAPAAQLLAASAAGVRRAGPGLVLPPDTVAIVDRRRSPS